MLQDKKYDVIVVGAGHAGCEAAAAAANLGSNVLLITQNLDRMGQMSCNPAMGGVAKGQIVREIDALGGLAGIVTDHSMIQFRMLNRSKGPAMWSPRAQSDLELFSKTWRELLEKIPNLDFRQDVVCDLLFEDDKISGVKTSLGKEIFAKAIVLTNGTFLNGIIHVGQIHFSGGRIGEPSTSGISEKLIEKGFETDRLKTGTPVRVDGRTIDFSKLEEQKGDENPERFSFLDTPVLQKQRSCYLAYTNPKVHETLKTGFEDSPMFQGRIKGVGPRYCPSIEDKINRFADKTRHQLFIEPQGWKSIEFYINGFSSSLPEEIQLKALRQIEGFENAQIFRPGYAIEYDYFPPTQLRPTLETKKIENLYFAGQINGTTGYEEAGAQGLMAGINAHLKINNQQAFVLKRSEAYIGVLIDDLVTKGVDEPYRMFTSRAEYRILLRQDNADERLTPLAHQIGLASDERMARVDEKIKLRNQIRLFIKNEKLAPEDVNSLLIEKESSPISQKATIESLLLRPQLSINDFPQVGKFLETFVTCHPSPVTTKILESTEILVKYESYIEKESEIANRLGKYEDVPLKDDFDYQKLTSLSFEAREKLSKIRPQTIGQAARIPGISPSDISVLIIYISR